MNQRIWITDHAAERYQERVRPTLEPKRAKAELISLARNGLEIIDRPDWVHTAEISQHYAQVADGIVLALEPAGPRFKHYAQVADGIVLELEPAGPRFKATTCLVRCVDADWVREARSQKRRKAELRKAKERGMSVTKGRTGIRLEATSGGAYSPDEPVVELVEGGTSYLWIGDERGCFGTVNTKRAVKLAKAILKAEGQS